MAKLFKKKNKKPENKVENFENIEVKPEEIEELVEKLSGSADLAKKINLLLRK